MRSISRSEYAGARILSDRSRAGLRRCHRGCWQTLEARGFLHSEPLKGRRNVVLGDAVQRGHLADLVKQILLRQTRWQVVRNVITRTSQGFAQGLQLDTEKRQRQSVRGISGWKSRYSGLAQRGEPSGVLPEEQGPDARFGFVGIRSIERKHVF